MTSWIRYFPVLLVGFSAFGAIEFRASEYQTVMGTGEILARGHVKVWDEVQTLYADEVRINQNTKDVHAKGNVYVISGSDVLFGQEMFLNLGTKLGRIISGGVEHSAKIQLTGREIRKIAPDKFVIYDGTYTTCLDCPRAWSFAGREIDLTFEEYVFIYDAIFLGGGFPAAYSPFLVLPVKTKRQSGLINPRFNWQKLHGYHLGLSYFWAMDENYDSTWGYDWFSDRGHLLSAEGRWRTTPFEGGQINAFGLHDNTRTMTDSVTGAKQVVSPRLRGGVHGEFIQRFDDWRVAGRSQWASDRLFTQEFGYLEGARGQSSLRSQILVDRTLGPGIMTGLLSWYQDVQPRTPSDYNIANYDGKLESSPLRAPLISYDVPATPLIWSGGYWLRGLVLSGSITGTNFQKLGYGFINVDPASGAPENGNFDSDDIINGGQRYVLAPKLVVPFTLGEYIFASSEILSKNSFYFFPEGVPNQAAYRQEVEMLNRIGTRVDRVFPLNRKEWKSVKHTIDVYARHRYTPYIHNSDHQIFTRCPAAFPGCNTLGSPDNTKANKPPFVGFDDEDTGLRSHKLGYEIQQRVISKIVPEDINEDIPTDERRDQFPKKPKDPVYSSFLYWGTDQDYDFLATSRPIGPLHNVLTLSLGPWTASADASTVVYTGSTNVTGNVRFSWWDGQFVFIGIRSALDGTKRNLDWSLGTHLKLLWGFSIETFHNFSQTRRQLLEDWYHLIYVPASKCWHFSIKVYRSVDKGTSVYPQFGLDFTGS